MSTDSCKYKLVNLKVNSVATQETNLKVSHELFAINIIKKTLNIAIFNVNL